ncbi:O-antigen chain-terminating methyltransferase [Candidatus Methanophagaceae archaeon]|nr:O-antigen chain-terminating methyltransferase [Methanophagales archaeon]
MIQTNIPEINVDELMEKIRAEVRRRKEREETVHGPAHQADRASQPAPSPGIDPFSIGTIPEPEPFEFKGGGYHINDFLKYHDLHFVMNAYRGILRRRPDSKGLQHFLKNFRSGKMSKAEVLGRLRYSPEGRVKKVKMKGLFWNFVVQSSFRIPVLGYFSRLTVGIVNLPMPCLISLHPPPSSCCDDK